MFSQDFHCIWQITVYQSTEFFLISFFFELLSTLFYLYTFTWPFQGILEHWLHEVSASSVYFLDNVYSVVHPTAVLLVIFTFTMRECLAWMHSKNETLCCKLKWSAEFYYREWFSYKKWLLFKKYFPITYFFLVDIVYKNSLYETMLL